MHQRRCWQLLLEAVLLVHVCGCGQPPPVPRTDLSADTQLKRATDMAAALPLSSWCPVSTYRDLADVGILGLAGGADGMLALLMGDGSIVTVDFNSPSPRRLVPRQKELVIGIDPTATRIALLREPDDNRGGQDVPTLRVVTIDRVTGELLPKCEIRLPCPVKPLVSAWLSDERLILVPCYPDGVTDTGIVVVDCAMARAERRFVGTWLDAAAAMLADGSVIRIVPLKTSGIKVSAYLPDANADRAMCTIPSIDAMSSPGLRECVGGAFFSIQEVVEGILLFRGESNHTVLAFQCPGSTSPVPYDLPIPAECQIGPVKCSPERQQVAIPVFRGHPKARTCMTTSIYVLTGDMRPDKLNLALTYVFPSARAAGLRQNSGFSPYCAWIKRESQAAQLALLSVGDVVTLITLRRNSTVSDLVF